MARGEGIFAETQRDRGAAAAAVCCTMYQYAEPEKENPTSRIMASQATSNKG